MKNKLKIFILAASTLGMVSCQDYLTEIEPGSTLLEDFYISTAAATQNVTGCYAPLMWEFNKTYLSEWFIGDIVSDDALKGGGSTTDMADAYYMENWLTTDQNSLLLNFYRAQFQGIGRCNLAIKYIEKMELGIDADFTEEMKARLLAECHFLRAYYYFRLVRVFAGVPMPLQVVESSEDWGMPRASVDEVYTQILADLDIAEKGLWLKSKYKDADMGRATKGAAQALLMKVNLYMASPYWQGYGITKTPSDCYKDALAWGKKIEESGEYSLCSNYEDNFTVAGENGPESVFEIQYAEVAWGDYGEGFGYTAGSFTQILCRSRWSYVGGGWGFNHPTQNLYDEFEAKDTIRRDVAILLPPDSIYISNEDTAYWVYEPSDVYYLGNKYVNNKYGMYRDPKDVGGGMNSWSLHASRGPLNNKRCRYADVLLMMAEAALGMGDEPTARGYINQVRQRAGLDDISLATDAALRHERRCELAMEGHRWFDLVRWKGVDGTGLKAHMDAYKKYEEDLQVAERRSEGPATHMQEFIEGKHEIFPIPQEERQLNPTPMDQNPGY